jgi:uncharacterized phage-associated protein
MLSAQDVAKYFLTAISSDEGDFLTNLKLQKLLYYAQGFSMPLLGSPLFSEKIEAWTYGPAVSDVYDAYKQYGNGPLPLPQNLDFSNYNSEVRGLLDEVYEVYGQYTNSVLKNLTKNEPPWKNTSPKE